jgi:eukaryotic-like serine/threonine-protein kinase
MPLDPIADTEWKQLFSLLDMVLEVPESERPALLEQLSDTSPELKAKLQRLLAETSQPGGHERMPGLSLEQPILLRNDGHQGNPASFAAGAHIGPYQLMREIGFGGMSSVWLAMRSDGQMQRDIALKLPHIHLRHASFAERFARERDILAALAHPHIARLYDAGISTSGQPYLAMEYVEGAPLLEYCDSKRLSISERLMLFLQVLDAVRYAHEKLVLHRDLKPSNILVAAQGHVQLLDFGIAKLIVEGSVNETELTRFDGRALTLVYASPEQILGRPLGTASDVYSLGVILHELLTGTRPYRLPDDAQMTLEEAILTTRPQPMSETIHDAQAELRGATSGKLVELLRGDLEAIVAKALRKEPDLRYRTIDSLREDLLRHQRNEPVEARRGVRGYVLGRFLRRYRWLAAASALILFLTLGGVAGIAWQGHNAKLAAARADAEAKRANAVKDFLLDIFKQSSLRNPSGAQARQVTAEQLLNIGAQRIRVKLHDEPELRSELLDTLGLLYGDLGFPDRQAELAQEHFAQIARIDASSDSALDAGRTQMRWGMALSKTKPADAIKHLNEALRILDTHHDPDSLDRANILLALARAEYSTKTIGDMAASENLLAALAIVDRNDPANPLRAEITEELGSYAKLADNYPSAERWERQSLDGWQRSGAEENAFYIGRTYYLLGDTLALEHRFPEAEADLRLAIDMITKSAGADHPYAAEAKLRLGEMYGKMARPAEGIALLQEALKSQLKTTEGVYESTETVKTLARLEYERGTLEPAEQLLRQNIIQLGAAQGDELRYGLSVSNLVPILAARGEFSDAERFYGIASDYLSRYIGMNSLGFAYHSIRGVHLALSRGDWAVAAQRAQTILNSWPKLHEQLPVEFAWTRGVVAFEQSRKGRSAEAIPALNRILEEIVSSVERDQRKNLEACIRYFLGVTLMEAFRYAEAESHLRRGVELREIIDDPDSPWLAETRIGLANCLLGEGSVEEARSLLQAAARAQRNQRMLARVYRDELRVAQTSLVRMSQ